MAAAIVIRRCNDLQKPNNGAQAHRSEKDIRDLGHEYSLKYT